MILRDRKFADSSLEEEGCEPSVPLAGRSFFDCPVLPLRHVTTDPGNTSSIYRPDIWVKFGKAGADRWVSVVWNDGSIRDGGCKRGISVRVAGRNPKRLFHPLGRSPERAILP